MISPIQGLTNMEMALYGGFGSNASAPSYLNNYMSQSADYSLNPFAYYPSFNGTEGYYPQYNPSIFGQRIPYNQGLGSNTGTEQSSFKGLNKKEQDLLVNYYAKNLDPVESFKGALISGGIVGTLMQNPRHIAHPFNAVSMILGKTDVKEMFKDFKTNKELWNKNHWVLEEAYSQMHRAEARHKKRWHNIFRQQYTTEEYNKLKGIMQEALEEAKATGNVEKVAEATEKLRHAYCRNGKIYQWWNKLKVACGGKSTLATVDNMLETGAETIANNTKTLMGYNNMTLKKAFQRAGGKLGLAFGAVEILMNWNKVTLAKQKDEENAKQGIKTNYAGKQRAQTIVKGVGNAAGWMACETLGYLAFAKYGAAIGTAFGPGIGTAIGAAAGFVCGSIGMWLAGKATKAIMGEDVANKIDAEEKLKTAEGQAEMLSAITESAKDDKNLDSATAKTIQKALNAYA